MVENRDYQNSEFSSRSACVRRSLSVVLRQNVSLSVTGSGAVVLVSCLSSARGTVWVPGTLMEVMAVREDQVPSYSRAVANEPLPARPVRDAVFLAIEPCTVSIPDGVANRV